MEFSRIFTFFLIGLGLSFDSFAVSVSCGLARKEIRFLQACLVASSLAFFQALMPMAGWLIGSAAKNLILSFDHWIAFGLLLIVGIRMIFEGIKSESKLHSLNPFKPVVLLSLSLATSIDALVVGVSYGFLNVSVIFPVLIIGSVTFVASMLGMLFGKNIPAKLSRQSIILGGIILIGIGIKLVVEHTWFL